jgi:Zn-dependent protease
MLKSWRLGSLAGFPIEVNVSFLILLGLVLVALGGLPGVVVMCLVFASVVLHELGHALVARRLGVRVSGIELSFFGGAAKMVQLPRTANHELAIAAAGPAVSLMLGGVSLGLAALTHIGFFAWLGWTNLVIAGFNLIPALPMDGGRILRAALTRKMDYLRATELAVKVSRVAAVAFAILGLMGAYQLLFLAPFLWLLGTRERMLAQMTAHEYAQGPDGYRKRYYHSGPPHDADSGPEPFGGFATGPSFRRFTIRQRGGRLVIEEL